MSVYIREPVVQGMFYPAKRDSLTKMVSTFLLNAKPKVQKEKELLGLIVPHAGYVYSGGCAAHAYKLIKGQRFDTVIVIGPSHYTMLDGSSVWAKGEYVTSLGSVNIDEEAASYLLDKGPDIEFYQVAHMQEHSVEVQIPFLQYVLKSKFELVPIIIGNPSYDYTSRLADTIYSLIKGNHKKYLIVASTDLSHYHNDQVAKRMDRSVIELVKTMNKEELDRSIKTGTGEACGMGSILTLLFLAEKFGTRSIDILNITNSGEVSGDKERVVGYMSAAVYRS
ncbi:MAG: AmmeMemoRadiSam system protein B [Spirochaetes bacterium]|nr:AmmeMemoRadiSam system protein B [Spirochaetota bacterium]